MTRAAALLLQINLYIVTKEPLSPYGIYIIVLVNLLFKRNTLEIISLTMLLCSIVCKNSISMFDFFQLIMLYVIFQIFLIDNRDITFDKILILLYLVSIFVKARKKKSTSNPAVKSLGVSRARVCTCGCGCWR